MRLLTLSSREPAKRDAPQIRLLKIEPREDHDDLITIDTIIVDIQHAPEFDALSYVWGDQSVKVSIRLNGTPFDIGGNLHAALRILRGKRNKEFLWVDAICINQSDDLEKNDQIPLMAGIYSKAQTVICWLGEASVDSSLAISCLQKLTVHDPNYNMQIYFRHFEPPAVRKAIYNLLCRPYWTRVWIIQENELAQQRLFLCGTEQITGDHMYKAINVIYLLRMAPMFFDLDGGSIAPNDLVEGADGLNNFKLKVRRIMERSRRPGLSRTQLTLLLNDLMIATQGFQATDPRDHIYGLLSLFPPDIHQLVQPDYTKSTTSVFVDFALVTYARQFWMISQAGIGHIHSRRKQTGCSDMPTWVPSYRGQFVDGNSADIHHTAGSYQFIAGGSQPSRWSLVPQTLTLRVAGVRADKVRAVSAPESTIRARVVIWACYTTETRIGEHPCGNWRRAFYQTLLLDSDRENTASENAQTGEQFLRNWGEMSFKDQYLSLMQHAFKSVTEQDCRSQFEKKVSAHTLREEHKYWGEKNVSVQERDLREGKELRPSFNPILTSSESDEEVRKLVNMLKSNEFVTHLDQRTRERSFVMTDNGYMGLAPVGAQVGDEVAVLLGCPVPLVLRRREDKFQVVGDTYIYGLMEGQAFERTGAASARVEDLTLE